jgi:hypothetical protein
MRNRSRVIDYQSVLVAPFQETWVGHGTYTVPAGSGVVTRDAWETMSDDVSKGRHFKEVLHKVKDLTRSTVSDGTITSGANVFIDSGVNCFWHSWGLGAHDFVNHDHIPVAYSVTDDQILRQTLDDFYNTNQVDSLLNVVESPELFTGIANLAKKLSLPRVSGRAIRRTPLGRWRVIPKFASRPILADVKRAGGFISGGYLYYSFGIAPIIADFKKVARNLQKYRKQLAAVVEKAGTKISVHRKATGSFGAFGANGANLPLGYGSSPNTEKAWTASILTQITPTLTCTVNGIRDHKYTSDAFQALDFLVSRFGGVGPASFLWERIPFSFVVDWFVDLSDVLNRLDNALTGNRKVVKEACISRKWKALCPVYKLQYRADLTDTRDTNQIALVELSQYHRQSVPTNLSVGRSNRFGKKQASLLAALVTNIGANLRLKR